MMNSFFCAEESQGAGEDLIGSAVAAEIYVLIECPPPWSANAFDSKQVPTNLRTLVQELKQDQRPIRPLLIYRDRSKQEHRTSVLIFRQQAGLSEGYSKQEFQVSSLDAVAPLVTEVLSNGDVHNEPVEIQTKDILVCTHGSYDKCCAKYGQSFYRQAISTVAGLALNSEVRLWQASHIGGHRFAPTAIAFPDGRYYGRLNQETLTAILTRSGDIQCFNQVYRGWGVLPWAAQVVERELLLKHGWEWFDYQVTGRVIDHNEDESHNRVELTFARLDDPEGGTASQHSLETYQADVIENANQALQLRGSCGSTDTYKMSQYMVQNLVRLSYSNIG
ncbi:sucrase ferredoxin [Leptolyngbya sp. DQ-M1]|uniref:sucrase ferredoxin n=1 Tax=Leptolyngbya sp. DQ-M1 TaxID=2933920 RepID=UPI00329A2D39